MVLPRLVAHPKYVGVGTYASHLDSQDPVRFSGSKGFGVGKTGTGLNSSWG